MTTASLNAVELATAVPAAEVLVVRRRLVGGRRFNRITVPGRAGSWHFDEEPGDRELELLVDIQADTFAARREAVAELAYWADVGAVARLIIDDAPDRFDEAILVDTPDTGEWLNNATIPLRFLVGPYSLAVATSSQSVTAAGGAGSGSFAIGDRVTAEPVVEVTAAGSALTSLDLVVNGYTLSWDGSVAAGDTLTISSISDTVTLGANDDIDLLGAFDVAFLDMADVSGEFPLLLEGTNAWSVTYAGSSGGITIEFTWRERFR